MFPFPLSTLLRQQMPPPPPQQASSSSHSHSYAAADQQQQGTTSAASASAAAAAVPDYLIDTPIASPSSSTPMYPLPSLWNPKDKCQSLGLAKGNLRVIYNGSGKSDSDAASIRSNHPIPVQCGIFYFEVEIISKGRDGYVYTYIRTLPTNA
jgi:hypothetical protein